MVAKHRFLNSDHIVALLEAPGRKVITDRLAKLFHHGYLTRPKAQLKYFGETGSRPLVYGLGRKGSQVLSERFGLDHPTQTTSHAHFEHVLLVSDLLVSLETSRRRHGIEVLDFNDILAQSPPATRQKHLLGVENVSGWEVDFIHEDRKRYRLRIYPDAIFAVPGKRLPSLLFLEADRGTEPLVRKDLRHRSSLYKKFLLYWQSSMRWRDEAVTPPYGFRHPRVLTVVTTKQAHRRIRNLQDLALKVAPTTPGMSLFASHTDLMAGDFLTHRWQNAKGVPVRLLAGS